MTTQRQKFDRIAWRQIRKLRAPRGAKPEGPLPLDFVDLMQQILDGNSWDVALAEFLDNFYFYKSPSFFSKEPPVAFPKHRRAFLAAMAEYLCRRFKLRCPAWTNKPEYFLETEWAPDKYFRGRSAPEFKRHGIRYAARNLIRL